MGAAGVQAARLVERSIVAIETGDLTIEDEDWHGDTMASLRAAAAAERAVEEAKAAAAAAGTLLPTACSQNTCVRILQRPHDGSLYTGSNMQCCYGVATAASLRMARPEPCIRYSKLEVRYVPRAANNTAATLLLLCVL